MEKYLVIIIGPTSTENAYVLNIFPTGNGGSLVRHEIYTSDRLKQAMKDCLNAVDLGFDKVVEHIAKSGTWVTEVSLSDECAARLGWF